jgi:NTP pyrophosphatase (non-canonical NTP hydrolase)
MQTIQIKVKTFCQKHKLNNSLETKILDLSSEVGELAKEVLKITDYGSKPVAYHDDFEKELGDVFYSLITIANHFDIDMEKALHDTLGKYAKRFQKGGMSSEFE